MPRVLAALAAALLLLLPGGANPARSGVGDVTVFAAASLTNALQDVAEAFTRRSGIRVRLSFAATSTLAKQVESGAGVDVFISADTAWMDYLDKRGLLAPGTRRTLAGNRLVLVVPAGRPVRLDLAAGSGWLALLPAGRIAIGDPAHVPAGSYAQQAFTRLGVWSEIEPRLARADNVRNALVLVERGEAAAGVVYATDAAIWKHVSVAAIFPDSTHDQIVYPVALLQGQKGPEARRLYDFLATAEARAIFSRHGFSPGSCSPC
jgi:molybdate transport system substrate-binding protein